jgi:sarcosine oxidase/L-pipecolate oxidase
VRITGGAKLQGLLSVPLAGLGIDWYGLGKLSSMRPKKRKEGRENDEMRTIKATCMPRSSVPFQSSNTNLDQSACFIRCHMPNMSTQPSSYNIIGAGIFGASTALHLIRQHPGARIRLFDRQAAPCHLAASWDWNKVVRADYTDAFSMKLALEAKSVWKSDPLFERFYYQGGMFWVSDTSLARTVIDLYKELGAEEDYSLLSVEDAAKQFDGIFNDADYRGVSEVLINRSSGWAEAKEALAATIEAATNAGVEYIETDITSLQLTDNHSSCQGAVSKDGEVFVATHTILCTGAGTALLLANSAPQQPSLQVGNRMVAAAICTGLSRLSPEDAKVFAGVPVCCQEVLPGRGEGTSGR